MSNIDFMKKMGSSLFFFILCLGLISCVSAGDVEMEKDINNEKDLGSVNPDNTIDTFLDGDIRVYLWEWKGFHYSIPVKLNLTDEELTVLFTKRDILREEIANLRLMIKNSGSSENLTSQVKEKLTELDELYEKYPFLDQEGDSIEKMTIIEDGEKTSGADSENTNKVLAGMKDTGMPFFMLALLVLLFLNGLIVKRKF